jgi:hypothetical protein
MACLAALIQGCSLNSANNLFNSKTVPDESQIRTTQSLSMPPDLQLPPPSATVTEEDGQLANVSDANGTTVPPADATVAASPSDNAVTPQPVPKVAGAAPASPADDIYARYGISKVKPDGTPKTQADLNTELRAAQLAEKRKTDPNYGTIFNIGDLFKDG